MNKLFKWIAYEILNFWSWIKPHSFSIHFNWNLFLVIQKYLYTTVENTRTHLFSFSLWNDYFLSSLFFMRLKHMFLGADQCRKYRQGWKFHWLAVGWKLEPVSGPGARGFGGSPQFCWKFWVLQTAFIGWRGCQVNKTKGTSVLCVFIMK